MEYITNPHELVIVGGSALVALEIVSRPTQDVDVLALRSGNDLLSAEPLPSDLVAAAHRVGEDFRAPSDWLNAGPTLRALEPTDAELVAAARWTRTQDPSPGFRDALVGALASFGLEDVDLGT